MRKPFVLFALCILLCFSLIGPVPKSEAASLIYFSAQQEGEYAPLHPYTLQWSGDVLSNGGMQLSDLTLTTTTETADVVMTQNGDIGADAIVKLGSNVDISAPVDASVYNGKWTNVLPLEETTYLLLLHNNQFAKIKVEAIFPTKALFSFSIQTTEPEPEPEPEPVDEWHVWTEKENVQPSKSWTIHFNKDVNVSTVNADSVFVTNANGQRLATTVTAGSKSVIVKPPAAGYSYEQSYTLWINQSIKAKNGGQALKKGIKMVFTIQSEDTDAPHAPGGITISGQTITWTAVNAADLKGYYIYYRLNGETYVKWSNPATGTALVTGTTVKLNGLEGASIYVTAVDTSGNESAASSAIIVPPADDVPPAPTGLSAEPGNGSIMLDWYESYEGDHRGFYLYVSTNSQNGFQRVNTGGASSLLTESSFKHTGLTNGTTYYYYVTQLDQSGNESPRSAIVSSTPTSGFSLSWEGVWQTKYGTMTLTQNGNKVTGTFGISSTINGTVAGNVLTGTYYQNEWFYGDIQFTLSPDKNSFTGWYQDEGSINKGYWDGTRVTD